MSLTDEEETTRRTYDKLAKEWSSGHLVTGYWTGQLEKFKQLLPAGSVLEVGCGGGRDAKELIAAGYKYVGTDVSGGLLEEAKQNNPGAAFRQVSLYDLNFPEPFDGFWCVAVLLHIPKKRIAEALQSIHRNIKPGGIGFIAVKEGKGEGLETENDYDGEGRFFAYWTNEEFKDVLRQNGFEIRAEGYKPMSERTKWLTYHVKVV